MADPNPPAPVPTLRERLSFDAERGSVHDGPRRYLLMRPDVLMGVVRRIPSQQRAVVLDAFAASVAEHGADSIRAYLAMIGGDADALLATTAAAAADLGWGRWRFVRGDGAGLQLFVDHSPFAAGHGPSADPVCAPARGMLHAVASTLLDPSGTQSHRIRAFECACVAQGAACCSFEARLADPDATPNRLPEDRG